LSQKDADARYYADPIKRAMKLARGKAWRAANKDKVAAANKAYCPDKKRAAQLRWNDNNPSKSTEYRASRRAAQLSRTPSWSESQDIAELYAFAAKLDGDFHIDHIIPLRGERVSGLHVYDNLQILPATDNLKKGNKHESL
jgi:5-methylcytosine-specific restriction endonuclease McrA